MGALGLNTPSITTSLSGLGSNIAANARADANTLARNPALYITNNNLGYILAIVAGALFLIGALLALFNLLRDKYGIHLLIILFALERIATYVFRCLVYKKLSNTNVEVFEILEAAGTAILFVIIYHVWAGAARQRGDGATKRGRFCHCCVLFMATVAALAGAGLFIAGAVLQDRRSSSLSQYRTGFDLRKAAVIVYGAIMFVFDILVLFLCCRRGARKTMPGLLIIGALLSAKAGFQIYAIWHRVDRYYENKFFWPLFVLTELLALLILVLPGFLRHALRSDRPALPVTDANGQYIAGGGAVGAQPYAPAYAGPAVQPTYK
jgi:hypothetical protein